MVRVTTVFPHSHSIHCEMDLGQKNSYHLPSINLQNYQRTLIKILCSVVSDFPYPTVFHKVSKFSFAQCANSFAIGLSKCLSHMLSMLLLGLPSFITELQACEHNHNSKRGEATVISHFNVRYHTSTLQLSIFFII